MDYVTKATRTQVARWMRDNAADYETATQLAEAANCEFLLPGLGLDDPDHWVWEDALTAIATAGI